MSQFVIDLVHHLHTSGINPLVGVIVAALLAALIEQRWARKRTPDFSVAYRDIHGGPPKA
jgi:hypothetical protein